MRTALKAGAFLLIGVSAPVWAATTVIGGGRARQCFVDAERGRGGAAAIENCTLSLATEALGKNDIVATHVNRGILHLQGGDASRAIQDFDRAIALDTEEAEAYLNKAGALLRSDDRWRESLPLFTIAIEKKTRRPEIAYFGRGLVNELAGNLMAAYADLKKANEIAPEWDQPIKELARYQVKSRSGG